MSHTSAIQVVVGYHALTAGSVSRAEVPERIGRGLAAHPVGVVVMGRLAVDRAHQGKGLGTSLLQDALMRAEHAAETVGVRAVPVHAIDAAARSFISALVSVLRRMTKCS